MDRTTIEEVLKLVPLFKELSRDELLEIVNIAQNRHFIKGIHVFMQDDPLENVYFIHSGKVKIYRNDVNGKEQIVSIFKSGDMFPHVGFFRKGTYPAFAQVIEDARIVIISIAHFEKLLLQHPQVCIKLFRVMGEKIIDLQNRLESQILNNTYEQIIKLLLRLADTDGKLLTDGTTILTTHFTNKDMANMIGTTRETVSRTLTKLKKKNFIKTDEQGYFIFDKHVIENELA
ncbi:Crp/Fnr family transcriptional regulator [Cytobacillus sp. S13-E01]|uniref:Crp/Fnr family transcriptional regulator n=1 Tax=Cytobacillus sp. S13-E01 TaxID=3031326 RepID=UPI0023D8A93E|nr:Crp/Fnr family transcriptional regulator [Cytobacillus sp. S13-E01]MDF0727861.1 Crp/Fnr family transcriptional regulator [Cytobacillus sp. S13-E01]